MGPNQEDRKDTNMIIRKSNSSLVVGVGDASFTTSISAAGAGFVISLLRDKLYTDKHKVALYETLMNALDARTASGDNLQVELYLSKSELIVKDHGTGMTSQDMRDVYFSYCNSTKGDTDSMVGGMGIGSKSPAAYTNVYFVTNRRDGKSTTYMSVINKATNEVHEMQPEPMAPGEHAGITVRIPLTPHYVEQVDKDKELDTFHRLIIDGVVFRSVLNGNDPVDYYYVAENVDESDWDSMSEEKRKEALYDKALLPSSVKFAKLLKQYCPYFNPDADPAREVAQDLALGMIVSQDELLDAEGHSLTYGDIADDFKAQEAILDAYDKLGREDAASLADLCGDDLDTRVTHLFDVTGYHFIPGAGYVFRYEPLSTFYKSSGISGSYMYATDGDMVYGIPGELPNRYSRQFIIDGYTALITYPRSSALPPQPSREKLEPGDNLDAMVKNAVHRIYNATLVREIRRVKAGDLGTNCLLKRCAENAGNIADVRVPYLGNSVRSYFGDTVRSACKQTFTKAYAERHTFPTAIPGIEVYSARDTFSSESGEYKLAKCEDGNTFSISEKYVIAVIDDSDAKAGEEFDLIPEDLYEYMKSRPGTATVPALTEFTRAIKSSGGRNRMAHSSVRMLVVPSGVEAELDKFFSRYRRNKALSGLIRDVDKFYMSDIRRVRNAGDYYERCSTTVLRDVDAFVLKFAKAVSSAKATEEVEEAASKFAEDVAKAMPDATAAQLADAVADNDDKKKGKRVVKTPRRKAGTTGTLSLTTPVAVFTNFNGYSSKASSAISLAEFEELRKSKDSLYDTGAEFADTVVFPVGTRWRATDVLCTVLLRGDTHSAPFPGSMLREMLGIKHVVRAVPAIAVKMCEEPWCEMYTEVDYIARLQAIIDKFSINFMPSALYTYLDNTLGIRWHKSYWNGVQTSLLNCVDDAEEALVESVGAQGSVSVQRAFSVVAFVLSAIHQDSDHYHELSRLACKHAAGITNKDTPIYSSMLRALFDYNDTIGRECIEKLQSAVATMQPADVKALVNNWAYVRFMRCADSPMCLDEREKAASIVWPNLDKQINKCYTLVSKVVAPFNKPLSLSAVFGSDSKCVAKIKEND